MNHPPKLQALLDYLGECAGDDPPGNETECLYHLIDLYRVYQDSASQCQVCNGEGRITTTWMEAVCEECGGSGRAT